MRRVWRFLSGKKTAAGVVLDFAVTGLEVLVPALAGGGVLGGAGVLAKVLQGVGVLHKIVKANK